MKRVLDKILHDEKSGGIILIICTLISLTLANSAIGETYSHFWHTPVAGLTVELWINDGLMAIFFLMVGLELKREIYLGEFSRPRNAILPIAAAIGGMVVPALLYTIFNGGTDTQSGFGIPMATDIAFALGVLSLLGKRVPISLKIFLMALAVIDDLGAIIVIAIFYTQGLVLANLLIAFGVLAILFALSKFKIYSLWVYGIGGAIVWFFMLKSGVHATIAGVLLAFAIPFWKNNEHSLSPSFWLLRKLHLPVTYMILPIFALANTVIELSSDWGSLFTHRVSIGILCGLVIGKFIGIFSTSFIVVKAGLAKLPTGIQWRNLAGIGFLGGIGFTVSIFITLLAFSDMHIINNAKFIILISSLIAGAIGFMVLKSTLNNDTEDNTEND